MSNIKICDTTLGREDISYSFKEKIEIARQLEKLNITAIEICKIKNVKTDTLLVRTISSFVKNAIISVSAGTTEEDIDNATAALQTANNKRIRIELPLSTVGMEYTCHKKAPKMLDYINKLVVYAKLKCDDVEFCAVDATRADFDFLISAINNAISSGATSITICDNACEMMPDDFAEFINKISNSIENNIPIAAMCDDKNNLATACSMLALKNGADTVKTSVGGNVTSLESIGNIIKSCGNTCGFSSELKSTELNRIIKQIKWITSNSKIEKSVNEITEIEQNAIKLDVNDDRQSVMTAVSKLGYDLSEEDSIKVYEEFLRVASKKNVTARELDAIIASVALQVPPTYKLKSYVINNGNIISATAQITLIKDNEEIQGICIGDGPIDAAFLAIEQITAHHYELDDFQIQSVTEGKEAMGSALVKLRSAGKLYSGKGISTDITEAGIRAYINAVNKIVYGE